MSSNLIKFYNIYFLQIFRTLYKSFKEIRPLREEVQKFVRTIKQNEETFEIFREFDRQTKPFEDEIFKNDPSCFDRIPLFAKIELSAMYERMVESERTNLWSNLIPLIRYHGMLNACGDNMATMESIAMDFVQKHKGAGVEEMQRSLISEVLSGESDMFGKMLDAFKKPGTIENIVNNIGPIIRGKDKIDFSSILKNIKPEDLDNIDEDFKEMQKEMKDKGLNLFGLDKMPLFNAAAPGATSTDPPAGILDPSPALFEMVQKLQRELAQAKP